jgi:short-subunit dehydrogenase
MQTPFQARAGVKEVEGEKLMAPEEVAAAVLAGIRARKTVIMVSLRARAMSLLARLLPRSLSVALWGRLMAKMR